MATSEQRYAGHIFEKFTERAREVVVLAQDEARALRHDYIGTEHLLLGLLRDQGTLAARVLYSLDLSLEEVRARVALIVGEGDELAIGQIPFTPRAKKVLELSLRESRSLGDNDTRSRPKCRTCDSQDKDRPRHGSTSLKRAASPS